MTGHLMYAHVHDIKNKQSNNEENEKVTLVLNLGRKIIFNLISFLESERGVVLQGLVIKLYFVLVVLEKSRILSKTNRFLWLQIQMTLT